VGCRDRAPASTLLRVVAVSDDGAQRLVADPRHRLPGRGAYLHVDPACLAKADKRRAFPRALRVAGILDTGELTAYVTAKTARTDSAAGETGKTEGGNSGGGRRPAREQTTTTAR
jgi:predicted RNA-binding protein YlxR (DUF448 family)